ncbi:hypothetical protein I350_01945 [Cryptococcus amylolentus CBS 6273]|uniref:Uncharacterized protein n=1 Tax=Cryptococcus amylolentus CBS 6273 TaxID=1296118 RepID=A0A1E3K9F0_9TREE|nr:hypothetical protein I350_01945 [Cryptococcus amylolentus CBS 6273]
MSYYQSTVSRLKDFLSLSGGSSPSKTTPPTRKDWKVLEISGKDMYTPIDRGVGRFAPSSNAPDTDDVLTNVEWKVLLEEAPTGDDGVTSRPHSASIKEFNETKQHLLSSPSFASRVGEIRNMLDVLSQGDEPSFKNFFTFWDGEYRIYGARSGFGDGQRGDGNGDGEDVDDEPTRWIVTASKTANMDLIFNSGRAPMLRRLEAIRRNGVPSPRAQGTAPQSTLDDASADDKNRLPMEEAPVTCYRSSLGIDDDHAFKITKSDKASKGQPLNEQILGTQPEDGYVEALTAASQLVDAAPKTADGHCVFSFNTPSGYHGTVGKRHVSVGDAD